MRIASYNARGLWIGHSDADKVRNSLTFSVFKQDLDRLNVLNKDFHGAGESTTDLSTKIV